MLVYIHPNGHICIVNVAETHDHYYNDYHYSETCSFFLLGAIVHRKTWFRGTPSPCRPLPLLGDSDWKAVVERL